jgi:hypothetical protein
MSSARGSRAGEVELRSSFGACRRSARCASRAGDRRLRPTCREAELFDLARDLLVDDELGVAERRRAAPEQALDPVGVRDDLPSNLERSVSDESE